MQRREIDLPPETAPHCTGARPLGKLPTRSVLTDQQLEHPIAHTLAASASERVCRRPLTYRKPRYAKWWNRRPNRDAWIGASVPGAV
jgi:hypothetical protein